MRTSTDRIVSVTEVSRNASATFQRVEESGEPLVVLRNNKPHTAIVSIESAERLDRIDEIEEDFRLLAAALIRQRTDNGARYDLEEVAREFGVDLDEDEG